MTINILILQLHRLGKDLAWVLQILKQEYLMAISLCQAFDKNKEISNEISNQRDELSILAHSQNYAFYPSSHVFFVVVFFFAYD